MSSFHAELYKPVIVDLTSECEEGLVRAPETSGQLLGSVAVGDGSTVNTCVDPDSVRSSGHLSASGSHSIGRGDVPWLRATKWGRCGDMRCRAPLTVRVNRDTGNPFLGCTKFRPKDPSSCRFVAAVPPHFESMLPDQLAARVDVDF